MQPNLQCQGSDSTRGGQVPHETQAQSTGAGCEVNGLNGWSISSEQSLHPAWYLTIHFHSVAEGGFCVFLVVDSQQVMEGSFLGTWAFLQGRVELQYPS